jgi:hypothetical protein
VKTDLPAASLAERVAEAQRAEVRPRNRVAELQGQFTQAVAARKYADADRLQEELQGAREALVMAEALTRGLREGQALADAQRAEEQQSIQRQRDEDEARRVVREAMAAESAAMDAIEESLAQLWATIGAAQDRYRQALALEDSVWQERQRAYLAQVALGERPDGIRIVKPNPATVLTDNDPVVRELARWKGPERRLPPPVYAAGTGGPRGTVQQAPW